MKLSVIIPVFQNSLTLRRCVDSVSLAFPEAEIIIVDDGSTDDTPLLCDSLAKDGIRVIHRRNGGLSAARNTGIEAASGDYITFVDSDDTLQGSQTENIVYLQSHPETDMLEYPVTVHYGSKRQYSVTFTPHVISGRTIFAEWISQEGYRHAYACNKIYRKQLFDNIRFPVGETFEDIAVCPSIIRKCKSIYFSDKGLYLYYDNSGGITSLFNFQTQEPLFRHNLDLLSDVSDMGMRHEALKIWAGCLNILTDLWRCENADKRYLDAAVMRLSALRPIILGIFSSDIGIKSILKYIIASIAGERLICRIYSHRKLTI